MITWKDDYSVGYAGIDEQHKQLVSIIQELETEIDSKKSNFKNLMDIVNKLDAYIQYHLSYEEELMNKYAYEDLEKHRVEHNALRYKILSINYDNIHDANEFFVDSYTYLVNWLLNHIMKEDQSLGKFLAQKEPSLV